MSGNLATAAPELAPIVVKAMVRAAHRLGLTQRDMASILGLSEATVSRLFHGRTQSFDLDMASGQLTLLFLRVVRSLDALVGGDAAKAGAWLDAENDHLGGRPIERLRSVEGLVHVAGYLDAMRGHL